MQGHVATWLQVFGSRKIKNMICARDFSLQCLRKAWASYLAANAIIFFALRQAGAGGCMTRTTGRARFRRAPFRKDFSIKHFQNFNTVSFKELHPLLLVSIPFQTNKINIRLSVKSLLELVLHPRGNYARAGVTR